MEFQLSLANQMYKAKNYFVIDVSFMWATFDPDVPMLLGLFGAILKQIPILYKCSI